MAPAWGAAVLAAWRSAPHVRFSDSVFAMEGVVIEPAAAASTHATREHAALVAAGTLSAQVRSALQSGGWNVTIGEPAGVEALDAFAAVVLDAQAFGPAEWVEAARNKAVVVAAVQAAGQGRPMPQGADVVAHEAELEQLPARIAWFVRAADRIRSAEGRREQYRGRAQTREQLTELIVHDLRNPLSGTTALLQMLQMDLAGTEAFEQATQAARLAEDMNCNLDEVVSSAANESGVLAVSRERVRLDALVHEALLKLQPHTPRGRVALEVSSEPAVMVHADRGLSRRAVENVLGQALLETSSVDGIRIGTQLLDDQAQLQVEYMSAGGEEIERPGRQMHYAIVQAIMGANSGSLHVDEDGPRVSVRLRWPGGRGA